MNNETTSELADVLRDRYVIERELGRGGMATVYLARDIKHGRLVALKVLRPELGQALGPERFHREIETVARLQHPHILTVHDSGETAGQFWFTMPFVEGESLRDRLGREQQLPVDVALRIAADAARALQYAHDHGVIHRDIKPENLLLTTDGSTLVADFGIARAVSRGDDRLTETGISVGTPAYMSPEQAAGERTLDARADVYALGAVLYEMLAGEPPFTGPTAQAITAKRFSGAMPQVRQVRPSVPASVEQAITRALALVPADRFGSAAEFARALQPVVLTPTVNPTEPLASAVRVGKGRPSARAWRRLPVAAMALGLGVFLGFGVLFAWRRSHSVVDKTGGAKVLAVLPFENLGDSADAYFADGVANDLRTKLSQVPGLQVIARGSSNEYRKTTKTQQQIARELGVEYLLTATVQWEKVAGGASRVRVSPELVDVSPNHAPRSKWGQQFDAALTDVFQVQADIATRVAEALNVALGAQQQQVIAQQPTANLTAYNAFLKGEAAVERAYYQENDLRKVREALHFYEEAVALDPTFVSSWVELALWYSGIAASGPPSDSTKARRAVEHAVALAPGDADVQLALGYYTQNVRHDPAQALTHFEAGLKVAPRNARLLLSMSGLETELGRLDEAVTHGLQAQAMDPRSEWATRTLAEALHLLRRYPEALKAYERAHALQPMKLGTIEQQAMVHLAQGDLPGARAVLASAAKDVDSVELARYVAGVWDLVWLPDSAQQDQVLHLPGEIQQPGESRDDETVLRTILNAQIYYLRGDRSRTRAYADSARRGFDAMFRARPYLNAPDTYLSRGLAWAYLGEKAPALRDGERGMRRALEEGGDLMGTGYIRWMLARIYIVVNEPEKAVDQVEVLLKTPSYFAPGWFRVDPNFAPIRGNPRFERLVKGA